MCTWKNNEKFNFHVSGIEEQITIELWKINSEKNNEYVGYVIVNPIDVRM